MKNIYEKSVITNCIGTLDKDEMDRYVINVETKDYSYTILVSDLLDEMLGTEIQLKSVNSMER
jgi:hypothetical protein